MIVIPANTFITALVPAYNEEENIGFTINGLKRFSEIKQIIVVDDGSTDNTAQVVNNLGVELIQQRNNRGKGHALNTGASFVQGDYIALIDADLKESVVEINKLFEPVVEGGYDMSIAIFPVSRKKSGIGLVKGAAFWGLKLLTSHEFKAPLSGQRVMKREVFNNLLPFASGFGVEVGMTIDALVKGYKIIEINTEMGHSETGRDLSGFVHRGAQLKDVFITLTKKGWRRWVIF